LSVGREIRANANGSTKLQKWTSFSAGIALFRPRRASDETPYDEVTTEPCSPIGATLDSIRTCAIIAKNPESSFAEIATNSYK
jgi:hypothetical protein